MLALNHRNIFWWFSAKFNHGHLFLLQFFAKLIMLPVCGKCLGSVKNRAGSPYLTCSGTCGKHFHFKCVNVSDDLHNQLSTIPAGLTWKCTECANKCVCLDPESLNDFLSKKFDEMVSSVKHVFSDLKTELVTSAENQIKNTLPDAKLVESFSDILKNKTTPVILIEPKNSDHDSVHQKQKTQKI